MPFSKTIRPKVNAIARQRFELAYYVAEVLFVNHKAMGTSLLKKGDNNKKNFMLFSIITSIAKFDCFALFCFVCFAFKELFL